MRRGKISTEGRRDVVADAKGRVENLTTEQVSSELDGEGLIVVDIREDNERLEKVGIPGSAPVPRECYKVRVGGALPPVGEGL